MAEDVSQVTDTPDLPNNLSAVADTPLLAKDTHPVFKKFKDSKIPVSKPMGELWKSRRNAGMEAQKKFANSWEEAVRYYNNAQDEHRTETIGASGNRVRGKRLNNQHSETENIVFATVNAVTPAVYAKNPVAEFTPNFSVLPGGQDTSPRAQELMDFARCCEHLVNALANKRESPGFRMKVKAKQAVIHAQLTNEAWAEYGYTIKELSSEIALMQLNDLSDQLAKAEDQKEIIRIEGELMAMEEQIDMLQPEGPFVRFRTASEVLVDCDTQCPDHSDAKWIMYKHMFPTTYLAAVYGERDKNGTVKSIYAPTHVLLAGTGSGEMDEMINNFRLFDTSGGDPKAYGYDDQSSFKRAQRTLCWVAWDKVTRRVYLFHDKDWTWPIWVWDDPYKLPGFFPMEKLSFITPPAGAKAMGEVSYYLDQQDAINDNNSEMHRMREWARRNIFYNKNLISPAEFDSVMKGGDGTGRGIAVPEGHKITDHIFSLLPPSAQFIQLFDNQQKMAAIDRITGTSVIMRNEQFKTNTTNEAINAYSSANQTRLDDKIDAVEDWIGVVYRGIIMLCVQFMSQQTVAGIVGDDIAVAWKNMPPREFDMLFPCRIEGGSTQKPTSSAKKKEATQMMQGLGQFVNAAPGPVLEIMLRMLEKAFDEVTITADDWKYIRESAMAQMQRGMSTGQGGGGGGGGEGGGPPSPAGAPPQGSPNAEQVLQIIDQLPPKAKAAFGAAISRGASAQESLKQIMDALQQAPAGNA